MHIFVKAREFLLGTSRKTRIVSSIGVLFAVLTVGAVAVAPVTSQDNDLPATTIAQELVMPDVSEQVAALEAQPVQEYVREEKVRLGDTIGTLFSRLRINDNAALAFIKSDRTANALLHLKAGRVMQAKVTASGELQWLSMDTSDNREEQFRDVIVTRSEKGGFVAVDASTGLEKRIEMKTGEIKSSLFAATDAAEVPDAVTGKFVDLFSTQIDFRADLRRGDRFNIVYETFWHNGAMIRSGRILAAEFVNGGKPFQAVWFDQGSGNGGYYGFDGKSQKRAFLKSPVAFTRISSGFGMRTHPVLGYSRAHKGIDFAAPTGTPIKAAADGTIESAKFNRGYGNLVVIRHWANISTAYGHMSRFASGLRKGQKVRQGDIIGYVGSTGMSTGPHLHYEYRIASVQYDPRVIAMPEAAPLAAAEMSKFRLVAADMEHRFALLNPDARVAKLAQK